MSATPGGGTDDAVVIRDHVLITGSSMNPARSLGPDIVANDYTGRWAYLAGPLVGAAVAVGLTALLRGLPSPSERPAAEGGALPL